MGKPEDEQSLPITVVPQSTDHNSENRCRFCGFVRFRCVFALLLGASVLLSAIFWLPPFLKFRDQRDLDLDSNFRGYEIVASFMLEKPVLLLEDNILKLEDDIFDEIEAPTAKVKILSLIPSRGSNITKVVFAVVPYEKNSGISSTGQSLIRANFMSLVIRQYNLRLTASLFGSPFSFEVLRFPEGITIIPQQGVFLLQKVQILFNFTLISSISRTQDNFNALTSELKSGLRLASYENLYIMLTNSKGSTVAFPTTVQTAVVLAVGNTPSQARLKQLAQTITGSHTKNLGLNNSVFGKVKQVRLSSILQHSLGGDASPTPAPSPLPHSHHQHHHHRHRHHHHHSEAHLAPIGAPAPSPATKFHAPEIGKGSPAPAPTHKANPPHCQYGSTGRFPKKGNKQPHLVPPVEPPVSPRHIAPSPIHHLNPSAPVSSSSPLSSLPHPVHAHVQSPAQSEPDSGPFQVTPSVSPSPSPSSAGLLLPTPLWAVLKYVVLVLLL